MPSRPTKGFLLQLVAASSLAVLAVVAMAAVGLHVVRSSRADLFGAVDHAHRLARVHELRFELEHVVSTSRGYLVSGDRERQEKAQTALNNARRALESFDKPAATPRPGPLIDEVR